MKYLILILSLILSLACLSARIFADEPQKSPSQLKLRAQNMILEGEGQRNISTFDEQSSTLKISCISCGNNFMAVNTDLHAADRGMDRDFCCHSNNKSSYDFNVWTCSKCGYSNHKSFVSFGPTTAFTDAEKEAIKAQWVTVFLETLGVNLIQYAAPISQEDIPSFLKYQMMLSILPKLNLPWKVKADFPNSEYNDLQYQRKSKRLRKRKKPRPPRIQS